MKHIASTLLRLLALLAAASVVIFLLLRAIPGDPARIALGLNASDEAVAELSHTLGTDRPLVAQYVGWIAAMLRGDFGVSLASGADLGPVIWQRAGVSLVLAVAAMVLSLAIALPVGIWLARRNSAVLSGLTQLGMAVPSFVVGIVAVAVFSVRLGWLPANGWGTAAHAVLPVLSLTAVQTAILARYIRTAVSEELERDYVRTARSTGASMTQVVREHVLRNAALPVLTVVGIQLSALVVSAVVVEQVFAIPGLGSFLLDSVRNRDITAVQSTMMLLVAFTLLVNALVDIAYGVVDPRVRRAK
ncbi:MULTISPECIES: ABC transporter permease [Corynebacterium]|uniref:ABC transporter permease n=2 Tax=Corynebacterium TaxID=1716 RepID=A0ABD4TUQ7_9CORY|nr:MULTISPECIES: ABC transporter permease [Corynebacterium]MCO6394382.1 ABC transporter permease [Corynebacterium lipophilum]MCQ4614486.1 ABC transporter permease [Corynebacterium pseudogenitalium]MCZ2117901.1 ABC transporter permease [Corynebacterium lipophilum]